MRFALPLALLLLCAGCATCREHPVACAIVVTTVAAGAVAATSHHSVSDFHVSTPAVDCQKTECR
jgi:hypothetical protein